MSDTTFMGVPREQILWFPTIDYDKCVFCMECDTFCPHHVFERREGDRPLVVANPDNCVVFCRACAKTCTPDAISFPSKPETIARIKQIREGTAVEPGAGTEAPAEYLVVTHDKFEFRIPVVDYVFNENDVWARVADGVARVGISDYMQQKLTDINYFDPPKVDAAVEQFGELGTLESAKAVFEIVSPVSGTVVTVNPAVIDNPGLINDDPYGAGWLVEVKLTGWREDRELLLDSTVYADSVKRKAAEE